MKIYNYEGKSNIAGSQIKHIRKQQKLSQDQLAARLQIAGIFIDQKSLSRIERQERFLADFELREIARVLHVTMEDLTK